MTVMTSIRETRAPGGPLIGLAGTASVRTPCGARRIENVRPGDLIVTRDNGLQAVRMVWTRAVTAADIAADPALAPIRLKPRAIGPMMPQKDLLLAAEHRVLVPGYRLAQVPDTQSCLLPARTIAEMSDKAFLDRGVGDVIFYNIVFDQHHVFCADGLPVESYLPTEAAVEKLDEGVGGDLRRLFDAAEPGPDAGRRPPVSRAPLRTPRDRGLSARLCVRAWAGLFRKRFVSGPGLYRSVQCAHHRDRAGSVRTARAATAPKKTRGGSPAVGDGHGLPTLRMAIRDVCAPFVLRTG